MGASLDEVLRDAQRRGFLGTGAPADFVRHAVGYLDGLEEVLSRGDGADLGSGGGIPGLVLACELPATRWHLIERGRARADWLTRSVGRLGLGDRVTVHHEAAEVTGRGRLRGHCAFVVARRFAAPAVAAECAAPLLQVGGRAVFSDLGGSSVAPASPGRWNEEALTTLGLRVVRTWQGEQGSYSVLEQQGPCPERFPRSPGVPARRPLF